MDHTEILDLLGGSPADIASDLRAFADAAKLLSSNRPRLVDQHPLQWVGVYHGRVAASGVSFGSLMAQLSQKGIPPEKTIVRFIDREEKTLIL